MRKNSGFGGIAVFETSQGSRWRFLCIVPVVLALMVSLAAVACDDPEPIVRAPTPTPAIASTIASTPTPESTVLPMTPPAKPSVAEQISATQEAQAGPTATSVARQQAAEEEARAASAAVTATARQVVPVVPTPTQQVEPTPTATLTSQAEPPTTATPTPQAEPTAADTSTPQDETTATATSTPQAEPTPTPPPTPEPARIEEINFAGVVTNTNLPSQVQVVFSLRNQEGHAIVLPAAEIQNATQVYERGPGTDGWEEIDYTETSFFVHTAENFDLEVVFVLDFTNSMAQARLPDGRNGIAAMLDAFNAGLDVLPGAHRIGVVEFHDRNADPGVLSALTTNRQSIRDRIAEFSQSRFDPGSSRVWDSVVAGANLFSTREQNPRAIRALVFLSDGRDTSSVNVRDEAQRHAGDRGVQLYAMAVGEVFQEEQLREMAESTGGGYYPARDVSLLQEQLQLLVNDLRGQYQVSYITLRRTGEYRTGVAVELDGVRGSMQTGTFDVARLFGPDNQGMIQFDPPSVDHSAQQATAFVRALHMPRNIDRIRFRLDTSKPVHVELVAREDGGLLDGWTLLGPDPEGFYDVSSPEPVAFGNFGLLFRLTISDFTERSLEISVEFDNSTYTAGKRLIHPLWVAFGPPIRPYGRIAFQSDRTGNSDIYVVNADGSGLANLTNGTGSNRLPRWSPDGKRVVFNSGDHVYLMDADGSNRQALTSGSSYNGSPVWSPDGTRIAFDSDREENFDIYTVGSDGTGLTRLTAHPRRDWTPSWSLDGARIAFASNRDLANADHNEIYVLELDGGGITRLTELNSFSIRPAWSPDGRRIAFYSEHDGDREIMVMNSDGTGLVQLTRNDDSDWHPRWSPDGRFITFTSNRDGEYAIYTIRPDGTEPAKLVPNTHPAIDPDWTAP